MLFRHQRLALKISPDPLWLCFYTLINSDINHRTMHTFSSLWSKLKFFNLVYFNNNSNKFVFHIACCLTSLLVVLTYLLLVMYSLVLNISMTTFPTIPRFSMKHQWSNGCSGARAEVCARRTVHACVGRSLRGLCRHDVASVDGRGGKCGARVAGLQGRSDARRRVWMCGTEAAVPGCERGGGWQKFSGRR